MVHELGGRGSGVRHHLSVSRDGRRLVAFTGKQRICVDLDGWGSCSVDQTFSVWDLKTYAGIATSQSLEGLVGGLFSISPAGHFVVITGGFRSQVVEVP
jgi:WD40 repeat protein